MFLKHYTLIQLNEEEQGSLISVGGLYFVVIWEEKAVVGGFYTLLLATGQLFMTSALRRGEGFAIPMALEHWGALAWP